MIKNEGLRNAAAELVRKRFYIKNKCSDGRIEFMMGFRACQALILKQNLPHGAKKEIMRIIKDFTK